MRFKKTITITCDYKCEQLPEDWKNAYEGEDLEEAVEESISDRADSMKAGGFREGEFIEHINLDIHGLETPGDGWLFKGWIKIEEETEPPT